MNYKYMLIHPDEDGNIVTFLTSESLDKILNDPDEMGALDFLSEQDLEHKGIDPQYWKCHDPEMECLLLEIKGIVLPKRVTTCWRI